MATNTSGPFAPDSELPDAHLMAAAPDMIAALKAVQKVFREISYSGPVVDVVRDAIAKAAPAEKRQP